jgi:hypothetical protein
MRHTTKITLLLGAACAACGCSGRAAPAPAGVTYEVGPGHPYPDLQSVAPLLRPGDVVLLAGGVTYPGWVRLTQPGSRDAPITVRGVRVGDARPIIAGGGTTVALHGDHYVLEGLEITGGEQQCVYHAAHDVTIRDSVVHDCPGHGIVSLDKGSGSLFLEYDEIHSSGAGENHHQIYVATDESAHRGAVFRMQHSYVHDSLGGNNVKSRAERNEIYYNWFADAAFYELDLVGPDGETETLAREDSDVVGNVLCQNDPSQSHPLIRIGGDGTGQTWGRYRFVNNTVVVGEATSSSVFRLSAGIDGVEMHSNAITRRGGGAVDLIDDSDVEWAEERTISGTANWVGAGSKIPPEWQSTTSGADPGFLDVARLDFHPVAASVLSRAGTATPESPVGHPFPSPLALPVYEPPLHALLPPGEAVPRASAGPPSIGAYDAP